MPSNETGADVGNRITDHHAHPTGPDAKFKLLMYKGVMESESFDSEGGSSDPQRYVDASKDLPPAEGKQACPCCHTHSRLVVERTLHNGFTSTVLCCSRHGIDPASPSVWSPSCMCSPELLSMEDGQCPLLPEACLGSGESFPILDYPAIEFPKLNDVTATAAENSPCNSLFVLSEEANPKSGGWDSKTETNRNSMTDTLKKTYDNSWKDSSFSVAPSNTDSPNTSSWQQSTACDIYPSRKPGVKYMRLPSIEAKSKEEEQQQRALRSRSRALGKRHHEGHPSNPWKSLVPIKDVVIKIIHKDLMERDAMAKAYYEVELIDGLQHNNIMPLLSSVNTEKELWLFFEHAELDDLAKYTKYQMLSEPDVRIVCKQLLPAIAYLHEHRIVHGDIKAQNLLLSLRHDVSEEVRARLRTASAAPPCKIPPSPTELLLAKRAARRGATRNPSPDHARSSKCLCSTTVWQESCWKCSQRCSEESEDHSSPELRSLPFRPTSKDVAMSDLRLRICDFGMAQRLDSGGIIKWGGVQGTHGYIAPEILNHQNYNEKVDMWAFGSLICNLLTAQEPFYPASACRKEDLVFHPSLWKGRSEGVKDFVKSLLCRDVSRRLSASDALCHPWVLTQD